MSTLTNIKIAIMQPYLFPYIGYFQLIKSVDQFIIYDDVQYIKRGWINRNNILLNNQKHLFTLSVKKDSQTRNINQRLFSDNYKSDKIDLMKTIEFAYHKAPYYKDIRKLLNQCLNYENQNISLFLTHSLELICKYLEIKTLITLSSTIIEDKNLKSQERIINIVKTLKANNYINSIGGKELYFKENFKKEGLELNFIQIREIIYKQFNNQFIPNLSIIDVLMFNSKNDVIKMLNQYDLV